MIPAASPPQPAERLHALDAVRGGALLLGVAFHATMSFLPGPQFWVVRDAASPELGALFFVSHMFRMTLFFLIAGFFGRLLLERRGAARFATNRFKRIVLVLIAFWPIVFTGIISCFLWGVAAMNGGTLPPDGPPPPPLTAANFPWTHLWFLYVLTLFYVAALALRGLGRLVDRGGAIGRVWLDPAMRWSMAMRIAPLLLAVPGALMLAGKADWYPIGGIPTPDTGVVPNAIAMVVYGVAFGFGWLLHRQPELFTPWRRAWFANLVLAALLSAGLLWQLSGAPGFFVLEPDTTRRALIAAGYMLACWAWTAGLTGAALRFLSAERPAVRYVSDASYWIYLAHLPVVMAFQVLVFSMAAPALVKYAVVLGASLIVLFASYHLLVRHSWIGAWLNGRKVPWSKAEPLPERAATT